MKNGVTYENQNVYLKMNIYTNQTTTFAILANDAII